MSICVYSCVRMFSRVNNMFNTNSLISCCISFAFALSQFLCNYSCHSTTLLSNSATSAHTVAHISIILGHFHYTHLALPQTIMLVSHCDEYMGNGLTNAVRHEFVMIANDRQTFVSVRKHSRSFLWCFECYDGLTSGECMENGLTNAIRHQFAMIAK